MSLRDAFSEMVVSKENWGGVRVDGHHDIIAIPLNAEFLRFSPDEQLRVLGEIKVGKLDCQLPTTKVVGLQLSACALVAFGRID